MLMSRKMLYPPPEREEEGGGPSRIRSNSYEPFRMLDTRIEESLRGMAEEEQERLKTDPKGVNGRLSLLQSITIIMGTIIDLSSIRICQLISRSPSFGFSLNKSSMPYVTSSSSSSPLSSSSLSPTKATTSPNWKGLKSEANNQI
jgi:hypothetical protein